MITALPNHSNSMLHVRVLWDIENISVRKNIGALSTVTCIQK
jgi:hypothetical protein